MFAYAVTEYFLKMSQKPRARECYSTSGTVTGLVKKGWISQSFTPTMQVYRCTVGTFEDTQASEVLGGVTGFTILSRKIEITNTKYSHNSLVGSKVKESQFISHTNFFPIIKM